MVAQSVGRVYGELWRQATYAAAVIGGSLAGSHYGLPGVAVGVSAAILYMFVATGHLALNATDTTWRMYLRVQLGAFVTAGVTCAVALFLRLLLEAWQCSSVVIAIAVLSGAAVPWSAGVLWGLADPDLESLRASWPRWCVRLVVALRLLT